MPLYWNLLTLWQNSLENIFDRPRKWITQCFNSKLFIYCYSVAQLLLDSSATTPTRNSKATGTRQLKSILKAIPSTQLNRTPTSPFPVDAITNFRKCKISLDCSGFCRQHFVRSSEGKQCRDQLLSERVSRAAVRCVCANLRRDVITSVACERAHARLRLPIVPLR